MHRPERPSSLVGFHSQNDDTVVYSSGNAVFLWHLREDEHEWLLDLGLYPQGVHHLHLSADGTRLVKGTDQGRVLVYRIGHGKEHEFQLGGERVSSVQFSQDGSHVLAATARQVVLIDLEAGGIAQTFGTHPDEVMSAALSPKEDRILTTYRDGKARLWASEGELLAELDPRAGLIRYAAFSPDGRRAVTCSYGKVQVWITDPEELITVARERLDNLQRVFSQEELKRYGPLFRR